MHARRVPPSGLWPRCPAAERRQSESRAGMPHHAAVDRAAFQRYARPPM